jgi:hypothetical protein
MQEEHGPAVAVTVRLCGKSPAVGRSHRVLQDRPLHHSRRQVQSAGGVASSMPPLARQRKRYSLAMGSRDVLRGQPPAPTGGMGFIPLHRHCELGLVNHDQSPIKPSQIGIARARQGTRLRAHGLRIPSLPVAGHAIDAGTQPRVIYPERDHGADAGRGSDTVSRVGGTERLDLAGSGAQCQAAAVKHRRLSCRPGGCFRLVWHRAPPRLETPGRLSEPNRR